MRIQCVPGPSFSFPARSARVPLRGKKRDWGRGYNTILLPKSGDLHLPENWRPISLQPTIYKILAAVMARRLASWAIEGGQALACPEGVSPYGGLRGTRSPSWKTVSVRRRTFGYSGWTCRTPLGRCPTICYGSCCVLQESPPTSLTSAGSLLDLSQ